MFPWFDGGIGIWVILVALINAAVWIGLIVVAVLGIRWLMRQSAADRSRGAPPGEDTALELLRQRYARGEIDAAEFEERKRTLGG